MQLRGFHILPDCIGCGRCMRRCPQHCIVSGSPYVIMQENCLRCGACAEICPTKAIQPYEKSEEQKNE